MSDWRERLAAYITGQLPSADSVEVVRVFGMPAGASNETAGIDVQVSCDGHSFDLPLVLRVAPGMQQRDGNGLDPLPRKLVGQLAHLSWLDWC